MYFLQLITACLCLSLSSALHASSNTPSNTTAPKMNLSLSWDHYQLADAGALTEKEEGIINSEVAISLPKDINRSPFRITLFNPEEGEDGERLLDQTLLIVSLGPLVALGISFLPDDVSGWGDAKGQWGDHVSEGAVWDRDDWLLNYVGHPYFGGVYYQVARKSGYNQWNSFTYSALMSAFYWEYGLEAFAERPSIQDLVVTPVLGWVYGEWAHQKEKEIRANGGRAMGSTFWGSTALFFLDPIDNIAVGVNKLFGKKLIKSGSMTVTQQPMNTDVIARSDWHDYWGIKIQFLTN